MNLTGADVQVLWTLLERLLARRHRQRPSHIQTVEVDPSTISVIVAADLPSEVGIIVETATHLVQLPMRDPTVATTHLAYATPEPHPIEATLRSIAATSDGRLTLHRTSGRATKAHQVNAVVRLVHTPFCYIADCDSRCIGVVHPATDAAITQGANAYTTNGTIAGDLASAELAYDYNVSYRVSALVFGTCYFCGSNAAIETSVLRDFGLDTNALVEDVDLYSRLLLQSHHVEYQPSHVATEDHPSSLMGYFSQQSRWYRGYYEVIWRFGKRIVTSPDVVPRVKLGWAYQLIGRELGFDLLTLSDIVRLTSHRGRPRFVLAIRILLASAFCGWLRSGGPRHHPGHDLLQTQRRNFQLRMRYALLFPGFRIAKLACRAFSIPGLSRSRTGWTPTVRTHERNPTAGLGKVTE